MAAKDNRPVAFNSDGARRIVAATKTVENQYSNSPPQGSKFSGFRTGLVKARTDGSGITAYTPEVVSPPTPGKAGSGNITLYEMDAEGDLTASEVTIKCWNLGGAIGANKDILVMFGTRGPWAVVEPCP